MQRFQSKSNEEMKHLLTWGTSVLNLMLVLVLILLINVLSSFIYTKWDLTEEKRYTLSPATKNLLLDVNDIIYVKVLLDGEFPAGFQRLREETLQSLRQFNGINPLIEFEFEDPMDGNTQQNNLRKEELAKDGILPTNLRIEKDNEMVDRLIYPYAIFRFGRRMQIVNLLENQGIGISNDDVLNNSVSLLEYKFADAIQKIRNKDKAAIFFTEGRGELSIRQTADLEGKLRRYYDTDRIHFDSIVSFSDEIDLLIMAGPTMALEPRDLFKLDQYLMNGGHMIWLIDYLNVTLDSIQRNTNYIPTAYPLNIDDVLFKYGARIKPNLILDLECSRIPQVIGVTNGKPQLEQFNYFYHPLIASSSEHPIAKNIDRVNMFFPSTIDTIKTDAPIKKEIILRSSRYSRYQVIPMRLNFEVLRYEADPSKFDKGPQPVAVLLEGQFESFFKNRVSATMMETLSQIGNTYKDASIGGKLMVVSDADFTKNLYDPGSQRMSAMGYNKWEEFIFKGNESFMLNSIEYMLDEVGVLSARSKDVKLRLLNNVKIDEERGYWQALNILSPLFFLGIFGVLFYWLRKRKYNRSI